MRQLIAPLSRKRVGEFQVATGGGNWVAIRGSEQPQYAPLVAGNPAKNRNTREALGKPGAKSDALQREQLPAWFAAVQKIGNPAISAYLQCLLLTGARPGELLSLRWADVNMAWPDHP